MSNEAKKPVWGLLLKSLLKVNFWVVLPLCMVYFLAFAVLRNAYGLGLPIALEKGLVSNYASALMHSEKYSKPLSPSDLMIMLFRENILR